MIKLKMMRMTSQAKLFSKAHEDDACFDIYASVDQIIDPLTTRLVHTGIKIEIPKGYEGIIRPRSGLSLKSPLRISNTPGTIDNCYRGEICVIMTNLSKETYLIKQYDRIAQFTIKKVEDIVIEEVDELDETIRGSGGFGSTGLNEQTIKKVLSLTEDLGEGSENLSEDMVERKMLPTKIEVDENE